MLLEFKVKNFRSFRDEQTLSMVATTSDTSLHDNYVEKAGYKVLRVAAIYGANASGKSNLVKAIDWMCKFVINSAERKPSSKLGIRPFLLDENSVNKPTSFEITFLLDDIRYQYGFEVGGEKIAKEELVAYPKGKPQLWFERVLSSETKETLWKWGESLKGEKKKLAEKTRDDALFLSVAAGWNNEQLTTIYEWFKDNLRVLGAEDPVGPITAEILDFCSTEDSPKAEIRGSILECLRAADLGISDIHVKKIKKEDIKVSSQISQEERERISAAILKRRPFEITVIHKNSQTGLERPFPIFEESDGTQRLFALLGPWVDMAVLGKIGVIDELERSLHPLLTRELIRWVQNPQLLPKFEGQLIFATHDTTLLDPELFRRDQIWFTEKDDSGGTTLYSMADYKERQVRKGEAMQKGYLSGRYGAIPILDKFGLSSNEQK
jgi:AAA15 family ATPase/GTPase